METPCIRGSYRSLQALAIPQLKHTSLEPSILEKASSRQNPVIIELTSIMLAIRFMIECMQVAASDGQRRPHQSYSGLAQVE